MSNVQSEWWWRYYPEYSWPGTGGQLVLRRGQEYVFPRDPNYSRYYFEGNYYYWRGGTFYTWNWQPIDLPVKFVIDPFFHIGDSAQGVPQPVWSCCQHTAAADPGVMAYHIDQMRLIRIGAFMARNTTLEVPIKDANDMPYLGPETPPLVVLRWDPYATTDFVGNYTGSTGFSDRFTGCVPSGAITTNYAFRYELYLEKEPAPHWIIRLHYAYNGSSSASNRTVVADCIGQMVGSHAADYVEVGSGGTAGHYRMERIFTGTSWGDQTDIDTYNERRALTYHGYVAASSASSYYLTDDGTNSGNNLFDATVMPAVRVLGHRTLASAPGATRTNWQPSSQGLGFYYQSASYGDPPISAAGDDYHFHSEVAKPVAHGKWTVQIQNRSASYARTYYIFAFGRRA